MNISNKLKTHCKYGHEFSGDNLVVIRHGRICRMCRIILTATRTNTRITNRRDSVGDEEDYIPQAPVIVKGSHEDWLKEFGVKKPPAKSDNLFLDYL